MPSWFGSTMRSTYSAFPRWLRASGFLFWRARRAAFPPVTDFSASSELVANPVQLLGVKGTLVMNRGLDRRSWDVTEIAAKLDYFTIAGRTFRCWGASAGGSPSPLTGLVLPKFCA